MKSKKSKLILSLAVLGSLTATLGLAACGKGCGKIEDENKTSSRLPAPEITATNEGLFWSEVQTAKEYRYKWNEDGNWTKSTECFAEYPATVGSYTFYVEALTNGGKSGRTTEFPLEVKTFDVSCQQVDNTFSFTGESVWYSVNGGEEAALDESLLLDFTAGEVGTSYTVEYYTKGGVWTDETKTYYVDGAKQTASLTVTQMLSAPVFRVNAAGNGLEWTADTNALKYEVKVDGASTEVEASATRVSFPTEVGEHKIEVRALTNGSWTASRISEFTFETKEFGVPDVTVTKDGESYNIGWDEGFSGWMLSSENDGAFTEQTNCSVPFSETTKLKLRSGYNADENVYYLESKTLSFGVRQLPEIKFLKDGVISWNETDEGAAKTYFISLETDGESFGASIVNSLNVSGEEAGNYVFKVYAGQYLDEGTTNATLYLPSEVATLTFGVLAAPELDYTTNKLLWLVDENASAYQYKINDGEWTTATEDGFAEVLNLATYHVRAIGTDQAPFFVTAKTSTLRFDPALTIDTEKGEEMLATFDDEGYMQQIANPLYTGNQTSTGQKEIITVGANAEEQAILDGATGGVLKLTAGNASPRNTNEWGNMDGLSIELFKGLDPNEGIHLIFRVYMVSNEIRTTDAFIAEKDGDGYKHVPTDMEGRIIFGVVGDSKTESGVLNGNEDWPTIATDEWVEYEVDITKAAYADRFNLAKYVNVGFQRNGKAGDVVYIDYIRCTMIPRINERTVDFDENPEYIESFTLANKTSLVEEDVNGTTKKVAKLTGLWKVDGYWKLYFNHLHLYANSIVKVTMKVVSTSDNGGDIRINGVYYDDFANASEWTTYDLSVNEDLDLATLEFRGYNPSVTYDLYLAQVEIIGSVDVPDYMNINFAELGGKPNNMSVVTTSGVQNSYYSPVEQAVVCETYSNTSGPARIGALFTFPTEGDDVITVVAGMKISLVVKVELTKVVATLDKDMSGGFYLNNGQWGANDNVVTVKMDGTSTGYQTVSFTVPATHAQIGSTLTEFNWKPWHTGKNVHTIYVKSVTITLPQE